MDQNFFASLDRYELLAFFSGYPLIYALIHFIAGKLPARIAIKEKLPSFLPISYSLVAILYLGLQLRNLYPDYSIEHIRISLQLPYLKCWALLALLFWIPGLAHHRVLSLTHSLVFFFLWAKDLVTQQFFQQNMDINIIRNDMKIYTDSLLLHIGTYALTTLIYSLSSLYIKRYPKW